MQHTEGWVSLQRYSAHEQDLPPRVKRATPTNEILSPQGTFDPKGPKLNILIRDKISFVGVAHLTRGR